ncbi:YtpI family protein [Paenibacillus gorillae]|uniref:YtpI family protein n=1 Tax=Paenibacillus gorillae TaxID=1243662 RepID=UPI0004BCB28F|nr:YtpI family protein [Paenibacillus gorillae]
MDSIIQFVFAPCIIISLALTVLFSFRSRRAPDARARGLNASRMNISMGAMLIFIAAVQLFLSNESTARIVIGSIFLVLGLFNLFAGLRNHSIYRTMQQ